jgi:hypothetical protein
MCRTPAGVAEMLSLLTRGSTDLKFSTSLRRSEISPETPEICTIETFFTVAVLTTVKE